MDISAFSKQIACNPFVAKSVTKHHKSTSHPRRSMQLAVWTCALVLLDNMRHDWKKYNQPQLEKKNAASINMAAKQLSSSLSNWIILHKK